MPPSIAGKANAPLRVRRRRTGRADAPRIERTGNRPDTRPAEAWIRDAES
jgi:hypothetical protein